MSTHNQILKEFRAKANEFLGSKRHANNLVVIVAYLEQNTAAKQSVAAAILTLEALFVELLQRGDLAGSTEPGSDQDASPEAKYRQWLVERYEEALNLMHANIEHETVAEATQALASSMNLLAVEGKHPLVTGDKYVFPRNRLSNILKRLASSAHSQSGVLLRFKEYSQHLDIVYHSWKILPTLASRRDFANETFACNYLECVGCLAVTSTLQDNQLVLCAPAGTTKAGSFEYRKTKKNINLLWDNVMQWIDGVPASVHKQLLIVLLERIMPHLEKPIQLTDFLMDSLDCGGPISLLALQGLFTLIQKHNITYPNIYEKLYSMFEPNIFHTKFKARLFYLADIFLSSTHLPENLVASFAKRLARLSLIAPPQDTIIMLQFIGNLILRHPALKRLMCAQSAMQVAQDPFDADEHDPLNTKAMESSLWEVLLLQKHAIPSVATAARFIQQPLPTREWDLAAMLEVKEEDMFDQEISKKTKQFTLAFERPQSLGQLRGDSVQRHWKLF